MAKVSNELEKNLGSSLKLSEPMAAYTNFKIGGPAKYLLEAKTSDELAKAVQVAHELNLPLQILGNGCNVLVSDQGFSGLVVIAKNMQWKITGTTVWAEAGVNLGFLVTKTVEAGLWGMEPMVAVPSTVGGAVYGNAGLPQITKGCIGDWVCEVTALARDKIIKLNRQQCQFSYRNSIFKQTKDVILDVTLELVAGDKETSRALIKKYVAQRKGQPYHYPSSGCIFTNVEVTSRKQTKEIKQKLDDRPKLDEFLAKGQLPASWLIDQAELKGKKMGKVQVSDDHANYIVNMGGGTAEEVVMLISYIKQQVRDKFGIELREEVQYIGF
ncbi:MAG: UDP-N-acetylmuramate dehydrogenase [Patescibacteria group bacterium]